MIIHLKARMKIIHIDRYETYEVLHLEAIGPDFGYPKDGRDLGNNFSLWTPNAKAEFKIENPELIGRLKSGMVLHFTVYETKEEP